MTVVLVHKTNKRLEKCFQYDKSFTTATVDEAVFTFINPINWKTLGFTK